MSHKDGMIHLEPSVQLQEARGKEDNWTGLTDPSERRKLQNRLHQRAWRRRRKTCYIQKTTVAEPESCSDHSENSALRSLNRRLRPIRPAKPIKTTIVPPLITYLMPEGASLSPHVEPRIFSIPPDHRLITLIQYNVLRASMMNMAIMHIVAILPDQCGGIHRLVDLPNIPSNIPSDLQPTQMQLTVPHDPWIDIIPFNAMRDNLILCQDTFNQEDFCADLVGGLYHGLNDLENRGILVWSDPWSPDGWELTDGFAKKWGHILKGCQDLIRATNRWRDIRGEERLLIEV